MGVLSQASTRARIVLTLAPALKAPRDILIGD
jgi:hypothetical protein